jgi:septum formation protein
MRVAESDLFEWPFEIVLASASPRRRELLVLLGISYRVEIADVDETAHSGEQPQALTTRLAQTKALAVSDRLAMRSAAQNPPAPESGSAMLDNAPLVLAADTVVVLDGTILGKPADPAEARAMLGALRGRSHRVLTGLALARNGEIVWSSVVETVVWMRAYSPDEVERYIASGSPLDKAGAYGIQDADFRPVDRIEGCYTNVVGLPLCEVSRALSAVAGRPSTSDGCQCDRWALGSTSQRPT